MRRLYFLLVASTLALATVATPAQINPSNPLAPLSFLLGTWSANTTAGDAGAHVIGSYTFRTDLAGHSIDRTTSADSCSGPKTYDCSHHDRLTLFADPNGANSTHKSTLFAFYLDNEGHVIYYTVSLPDPQTAIFLSQGPPTAPRFRLTYHLEGTGPKALMIGKFQMAAPGSDDFHSYLEWSGTKQ